MGWNSACGGGVCDMIHFNHTFECAPPMAVQLLQCEVNRSTVCDGRGLFAYVPMAPGNVRLPRCVCSELIPDQGTEIVRVPPFATVLFSEMVDSLCSACMTDQSVDKRCSACKQVRYCGIECQASVA